MDGSNGMHDKQVRKVGEYFNLAPETCFATWTGGTQHISHCINPELSMLYILP